MPFNRSTFRRAILVLSTAGVAALVIFVGYFPPITDSEAQEIAAEASKQTTTPTLMEAKKSQAQIEQDIRTQLSNHLPGVSVDNVSATPIPGIYQILVGTQVGYVSEDGKYFLRGELLDLDTNENLSEKSLTSVRKKMIVGIKDSDGVIFSPKKPKHTVTVFTDIDCGYCRKFHSQIDEVMSYDIAVRYLFYPRTGPNTESWTKAEQVWCSKDKNKALTQAKLGEKLETKVCSNTAVMDDWQLGKQFGLRGTPTILFDNGEMVPGYMSPDELAERYN